MKRVRQRHQRRISPRVRKILYLSLASLVGVFIIVNAVLWAVYRERTYPRTKVMGTTIGSVSYGSLSQKVSEKQLLPEKLVFRYEDTYQATTLADLGIHKDVQRTVKSVARQRSWLPIANLFKSPVLQAPVHIDESTLALHADELSTVFRKDPVNAHLTIGENVGITEAHYGYELEKARLTERILKQLDAGQEQVAVPVIRTTPKMVAADLKADQQELQAQLETAITYAYKDKSRRPTKQDIAKWYAAAGEKLVISTDAIAVYVTQTGSSFGIHVADIGKVASATQQALTNKRATTITLTAQTALKTYTYCTAVRGVDAAQLGTLRSKLTAAYADSRGWSLGGNVAFREVASGCDFTVWLAASEQMTSFGGVCDATWSCRMGPNVVINYTRWTETSPAWNAAKGTVDEYRNMVINHETGHWLGFSHRHCGGPGQSAPVMQQQSIDLQGCTFSAWPSADELGTLRQKLGI